MGFLTKKKENVPQASPTVSSLRFNTSCFGKPIPIFYGRTRMAGNLIWYGGFKAIAHTTQQSVGGKGGGSETIEQTTYTYEVALLFAFGYGPTAPPGNGYAGRNIYPAVTQNNITLQASEQVVVNELSPTYDVTNKSAYTGVLSVELWTTYSQGDSGDFWAWGATNDYTVNAGTFTFGPSLYGRQVQVNYEYNGGTNYVDSVSAMGLSYFAGLESQTNWSWMDSNYASEALAYRGICYAGATAYQLGGSADIPNTSLELQSFFRYNATIPDANPKDVVLDLATNQLYGGYFDASKIADLSNYSDYCVAQGLFVSPAYTEQQALSEMLSKIAAITNSDFVFSDRKLRMVPYADKAVTGNGKTWTPNLTAVYEFTDDTYLPNGDGGPLVVKRKSPQERYNFVTVKFYNRERHYVEDVVDAKDTAHIERYGMRPAPLVELYEVADPSIAKIVAQLVLQRHISINNTYVFKVPFSYCLLDPMDLVTVTDATLGLDKALCRVTQIEENDDELTIEAEEVPVGSASAILYPRQVSSGYVANYSEKPQAVEPPLIVEAPSDYSEQTGLGFYIAATGKAGDNLWGGCYVWVSLDGSTYRRIGQITSLPRYGSLNSSITASGTQTIDVTLSGRGGQMLSGTAAEAASYATLCALTDGGQNIEYLSHQNAVLVSENRYTLNPLVRGQFDTPASSWNAGTKLLRVDGAPLAWLNIPFDYIGKTIYFKFTSFNIYGGGQEDLSDAVAYSKFVYGTMVKLPPPTVSGLTVTLEKYGIRILWTKSTALDVVRYEIRRGTTSDTWDTATFLVDVDSTSYLWEVRATGSYRFFVKAYDRYGTPSSTAAQTDYTISAPSVSNLTSAFPGNGDVRLSWTGNAGSFAIFGYELRYGSTWAGGTPLGFLQTTTYTEAVKYGGTRKYWVTPIDVANNYGTPVSLDVVVSAPSAVQSLRADVVDNNVLLFWVKPATGSLPVERYEVRKGTDWASGTVIGSNGSSTFTTYFEVLSGTYTYWVSAVDTAGNYGAAASIAAKVDQPPDFKLNYNQNDDFSQTKVNAIVENGKLIAPINATETWTQHFTNNGKTTFQDFVTGGYNYYSEPVPTSATYTTVVDIGTTLTSSIVSWVMTSALRFGEGVSVSVQIDVSNTSNTGPWAQEITGTSGFFSNFRWARFRLTFTGSGGNDQLEVSIFNERAAVKLGDASGTKACLAADAGGTLVYLTDDNTAGGNKLFVDVDSIVVTPQGTGAIIPVVDFTDSVNPLSFKVLLFNDSGTRIDGTVRWQANGVRAQ